jgi:hypothetical protein
MTVPRAQFPFSGSEFPNSCSPTVPGRRFGWRIIATAGADMCWWNALTKRTRPPSPPLIIQVIKQSGKARPALLWLVIAVRAVLCCRHVWNDAPGVTLYAEAARSMLESNALLAVQFLHFRQRQRPAAASSNQ